MKHFFVLLVALFVLCGVHAQSVKQLSLEDFVVKYTFQQETVSGIRSMNDGLHFTTLKDNKQIVKYSYKTGDQVAVILDLATIAECPINTIENYTFSNDERRILLQTNKKRIYRHSYTAEFYIWDIQTRSISALSDKGPQQVPLFSPDGERIAFVRDNNLFIKTIKFGTEFQITSDGKKNEIINGIPDWVQEEEFGYDRAFEWSPDSKMIAFLKFNESDVPLFTMPVFKGLAPERNEG